MSLWLQYGLCPLTRCVAELHTYLCVAFLPHIAKVCEKCVNFEWIFLYKPCMCLQRHPGEKMLGVLPRISIEFKSTYTATATKEYDMVSQSFFSRVVLCCCAVLSACEPIHLLTVRVTQALNHAPVEFQKTKCVPGNQMFEYLHR